MKRILTLLLLLGMAAVIAVILDARHALGTPVGGEARTVFIQSGSSFRTVVGQLESLGVIRTPRHALYVRAWARVRGQASRVRSGEYEIEPGMTLPQVLNLMVSGRHKQYRLTIVEGSTFSQLRAQLAAHDAIDNRLADQDAPAVMTAIGAEGEHPEGRFMPDTYYFPRGFTDQAFLKRAYSAMATHLEQAWAGRADDLPLENAYDALKLASIIEKETGVPAERDRIAGVFVRRLQRGMLLQTDPVVIYGIEDFDGNLRRVHLRSDGPYNSYRRPGLPPTPIALPGRESIHAALHPADGDSLYFVSRGDGSHKFSATLAEHNRAVRKYQLNKP